MFKTATRYLSGVSLFLGDDITSRDTVGELVFFMGPATRGPNVPIDIKSIDNMVGIYGTNNPLVKAAYQFMDGYNDSKQAVQLRPVVLRVGGINAQLVTSYGLSLTTTDAYDGIESDFYVFVSDITDSIKGVSPYVKAWDSNKLLVLDTSAGINSGYFDVTNAMSGSTGTTYGIDIDNDPKSVPVTLADLVATDTVKSSVLTVGSVTSTVTSITVSDDINAIASVGQLVLTGTDSSSHKQVSFTLNYTIDTAGYANGVFTIPSSIGFTLVDVTIKVIGSSLVKGDSELNMDSRTKYEKFKNALKEIELYTPDYLIPAGVSYNETWSYQKDITYATITSAAVNPSSVYVPVHGAALWDSAGSIDITFGSNTDQLDYKSITAQTINGATAYLLSIVKPTFSLVNDVTAGDKKLKVTIATVGSYVSSLYQSGTIDIKGVQYQYTSVSYVGSQAELTVATALPALLVSDADVITKVISTIPSGAAVTVAFSRSAQFDLGIGYVKETVTGDTISFEWSADNEKFVAKKDSSGNVTGYDTYYLAHFGYLFADFCQQASIGYNTPLCGMNVSLPNDVNSRASIVEWIGNFPSYVIQGGVTSSIEAIGNNGVGLLGDATRVGSKEHNRCYLSKPLDSIFTDPAYGLLLTNEGFIDGSEIIDSYGKVVDLGKFMCVGAALLTFSHRASSVSYVDTCGIYALGLLSGTPPSEGISFSRIATGSNVGVSSIVSRSLYNDLAKAGYIVITREKGLGWVINNDNSVVRNDSGYFLISTTRTVKTVIESKRSILVNFIGKPLNTFYLEAAKTKLAEDFSKDIKSGLLNGFKFNLTSQPAATAIGKLLLTCSLNPAIEITQIDIDTVIDRNVTTQG